MGINEDLKGFLADTGISLERDKPAPHRVYAATAANMAQGYKDSRDAWNQEAAEISAIISQFLHPKPLPAPATVGGGVVDDIDVVECARIMGSNADNMRAYWPLIAQALRQEGIYNKLVVIGVLATITVESRTFKPIGEYSPNAANISGGIKYKGRGFIQLTHDYNYRSYGKHLGIDLLGDPERANEPAIAARVLAKYFKDRKTAQYAMQQNWEEVRRSVNGRPRDKWDIFYPVIVKLLASQAAIKSR